MWHVGEKWALVRTPPTHRSWHQHFWNLSFNELYYNMGAEKKHQVYIRYILHAPPPPTKAAVKTIHPWNTAALSPSLSLFFSCRHVAKWFVIGSTQQNSRSKQRHSPPLFFLPSYTRRTMSRWQRFALQPATSLPLLLYLSKDTFLIIFGWCHCFFFVQGWLWSYSLAKK